MKINRPFLSINIRSKIIILSIACSLLPLVLIASLTFVYLSKVVENKVSDTTSNLLGSINWNIQTFVNDVETISKLMLSSRDVQTFLSYNKDDFKEIYDLQNDTRNLIVNISNNKSYIRYVYVGSGQRELIVTNQWDRLAYDNIYQAVSQSKWYRQIIDMGGKGLWLNSDEVRLVKNSPDLLLYGKRLNNLDTLDQIGMLIISIDSRVFDEMFKDITNAENGHLMILEQNKVIYHNSRTADLKQMPQKELNLLYDLPEQGTRIETMGGERYVITFDTNPGTQWKVVSMIPYSNINSEIVFIRNVTFSLTLVAFLLAAYGSYLISNRITKQLTLLTSVARKAAKRDEIEGILFAEEDEIGKIGNQFLRTFRTNTELSDKLIEAKLKEKEAELHALQSQINPHFLYNTLNSIYLMAERIGAKNISKMVMSLSNIFKLSLNNGDYITTVGNEIDQVKNYLEIQNIRYNGKFEVTIDLEPGIEHTRMLKLLIQPLVENAIFHGIELKEDKGNIAIRGRKEGETLVFEVEDDGVGFDPAGMQPRGYALRNIQERIQLHYGQDRGIRIDSVPGAGTKVTLEIGIMN
ncbi:sensor histidine kinase [Cohnella luojiensis]|uniref:Sensor histidine kinase n=1 Tax=Cohnella luojiensis TaxID=652876 RepID=A0A4Y8LPH7_9BACL|nr:sensor histidine kinase [Cohnella luojiensis]TFE19694.1 sensor histidine kinase [Cohnella luojiensis]